MKKRFTDDDILRFLYHEMNAAESDAFLQAVVLDESLWERFESLQKTTEQLEGLSYEPSEASLEKVRAVAREVAAEMPATPPAKRKPLWAFVPKDVPLKAVATVAFLLFMTVAITGSFYTLERSQLSVRESSSFTKDELVQEYDANPLFEWDDSALDRQLDEIRTRVEAIEATL
jgi:hypothetical protein